jgi:hypothetical protein
MTKPADVTAKAREQRISEIAERVEKAKFPEGHVHEGMGDLLSCQPCQTANKYWVEMLENSPQDIPFLLEALKSERSSAIKEAREECARAVCEKCKEGDAPLRYSNKELGIHSWLHSDESICGADAIRELIGGER